MAEPKDRIDWKRVAEGGPTRNVVAPRQGRPAARVNEKDGVKGVEGWIAANYFGLLVLLGLTTYPPMSGITRIVIGLMLAVPLAYVARATLVRWCSGSEFGARICTRVLEVTLCFILFANGISLKWYYDFYSFKSAVARPDCKPVRVWHDRGEKWARDKDGEIYIWSPELGMWMGDPDEKR